MKITIRFKKLLSNKALYEGTQVIEEKDYRRVKLSLEKLGYEVSKEEKK